MGTNLTRVEESSDGLGIIPRALAQIFQSVKDKEAEDSTSSFVLKASFSEIYCESVRDLLSPDTRYAQLGMHSHIYIGFIILCILH